MALKGQKQGFYPEIGDAKLKVRISHNKLCALFSF